VIKQFQFFVTQNIWTNGTPQLYLIAKKDLESNTIVLVHI